MPTAARLTQSQRDILALYRRGLRMIRTKEAQHQKNFTVYLRYFFKHPSWGGGLKRKDFSQIEYLQRKTQKLLESTFEPPSVKHINLPVNISKDMKDLNLDYWKRTT